MTHEEMQKCFEEMCNIFFKLEVYHLTKTVMN